MSRKLSVSCDTRRGNGSVYGRIFSGKDPMNLKKEWKPFLVILSVFLVLYFLPLWSERFRNAVMESLFLARWYAREHVLLCLVPAFFIAGGIAVFISNSSVMKYLGRGANKFLSYGVASVSGTVLAVCSCTVLPLFAGIYRMGAGIGPATAFLYSGPAINVLAIILTARILGADIGMARAVGAVLFSLVIGLLMHLFFSGEEESGGGAPVDVSADDGRPLYRTVLFFAAMVGILVFANWGKPDDARGVFFAIHAVKWHLTSVWAVLLGVILVAWYGVPWWKPAVVGMLTAAAALIAGEHPVVPFFVGVAGLSVLLATGEEDSQTWLESSWGFVRQIVPLLFVGVVIAGFLLGRPGETGIIPPSWIERALGGNGFGATLFASVAGAFMYFATLTEVPIVQGLMGSGMGKGPALALLLAGPALSLPNMLVIRSVIGTKKTVVFVTLVVIMATAAGLIFGSL